MKTHTFSVTLTFSEKVVSDDEILEVMRNLLEGITTQANNQLAPEGDAYTTKIDIDYPLYSLQLTRTL